MGVVDGLYHSNGKGVLMLSASQGKLECSVQDCSMVSHVAGAVVCVSVSADWTLKLEHYSLKMVGGNIASRNGRGA